MTAYGKVQANLEILGQSGSSVSMDCASLMLTHGMHGQVELAVEVLLGDDSTDMLTGILSGAMNKGERLVIRVSMDGLKQRGEALLKSVEVCPTGFAITRTRFELANITWDSTIISAAVMKPEPVSWPLDGETYGIVTPRPPKRKPKPEPEWEPHKKAKRYIETD